MIETEDLITTCRRSTFYSSDEEFKTRDIEIICRRGKEILAIAKFREWDTCGGYFSDGQSFVMSADERTQADYECAEMIMDHWVEDGHPLESGEPLIIFDRLVIAIPYTGIWPALTAAIDKAFKRRGGTMVLKAFPLEWEGAADGRPVADEPMFARRLTAMRKLYRQRLGMQDIPDNSDGWMWKAIGHSMPPSSTKVNRSEGMVGDLEG
ncbi:hypothetical protein GFB56_35975 [Ensifer sp. T173]|uniref:Uncharacterized protein n=1 Tax=Ensifer canadensis TaxID=555315 RepID=A0AAW4FXC2_9HYPH|nr:hypothetical protein [Ensifer canadensis]MBM3096070.1 hypothetical protein [Ensifer canadensis]UBI73971.1 hypothetical protein J3R84_10595 [Ensifer canadensis]